MVPLLAVLFILVPLAELAVILTVAHSLGVLDTLALLLLFSLFGAWLAKRQGFLAWRRLRLALEEGRLPTAEIVDGALILLAGALLFTPGFITDAIGLALLLPPTRALLRRAAPALALRRMARRRIRVRDTTTEVRWGRPEIDDRRERL
jgi:UPF0716 protein FxsA